MLAALACLLALQAAPGKTASPAAAEDRRLITVREFVVKGVIDEDRVNIRLKPYASFMTPPRHVRGESDMPTLTHWTSATVPWDAE